MNGLTRYVLVATPVCLIVFLTLSLYFTTWHGSVISYRPVKAEAPVSLRVLIVTAERDTTEADWPAQLVTDLALPADNTGVPPVTLPTDMPSTVKERFSLSFTVEKQGEPTRVVSTLAPQPFYTAVLLWLIGLLVNNMRLSGTPWRFTPAEFSLPEPLPTGRADDTGAPPLPARPQSKKGPPPPRPRKGLGRR
jgi:hypothetical protein